MPGASRRTVLVIRRSPAGGLFSPLIHEVIHVNQGLAVSHWRWTACHRRALVVESFHLSQSLSTLFPRYLAGQPATSQH
ncbi:hypothetical protein KCP75_05030 [Salmonella enterica subsp. enterica]|nr:hypothetical protein KCP75_05030 [Salmonella enterica subsp. enterica]